LGARALFCALGGRPIPVLMPTLSSLSKAILKDSLTHVAKGTQKL